MNSKESNPCGGQSETETHVGSWISTKLLPLPTMLVLHSVMLPPLSTTLLPRTDTLPSHSVLPPPHSVTPLPFSDMLPDSTAFVYAASTFRNDASTLRCTASTLPCWLRKRSCCRVVSNERASKICAHVRDDSRDSEHTRFEGMLRLKVMLRLKAIIWWIFFNIG